MVDEGLRGPMRSVRVEKAKVSQQGKAYQESPRALSRVINFDEEGRRAEEMHFDSHSSVVTKIVFVYDALERLAETTQYNNEMLTMRTLYTYEATGKVKEVISQVADGKPLNKVAYGYDDKGNRIEAVHYGANGSLRNRLVANYDDRGRMIEVTSYKGSQQGGILIRRDGKQATLMPVDKLQPFKGGVCEDGFLISRSVFTYGKESETKTLQYAADGTLISKTVFIGDASSKQIETAQYNSNRVLQNKEAHTREFDSRDNWVKDTKSLLDVKTGVFTPVEVTYRTISY